MPDTVSIEARRIIQKLLEVDSRRRMTARELVKEAWVRCNDLPLTIFENAATYQSRGGATSVNRASSLETKSNNFERDNFSGCHTQAI